MNMSTSKPFTERDTTGALIAESHAHDEVHHKNHYYVYHSGSVDNGNKLTLRMVTPDTAVRVHIFFEVYASFKIKATLYENPDSSIADVPLTPVCQNRNSPNTPSLTVAHTVATVPGQEGTNLESVTIGSATGAIFNRFGGNGRTLEEYILKQNTVYLIFVDSYANSNNISVLLRWYEES